MKDIKLKLIDLSYHNGEVDFVKVKGSGIDGVILRDGYGLDAPGQKDKRFDEYYAKAKAVGLLVGAYHYSYAKDVDGAVAEAKHMLKNCKGKSFELPLYYDIEDKIQQRLSKKTCTAMVQAFCDTIEHAGGWAGVYSYDSFFVDKLERNIPQRYTAWVARLKVEPKCVKADEVGIWQWSFTGKVDGIKTDVDMDYCYRDFPRLISAAGMNKF